MALTVRGLFWHPNEHRLRAPWRFGAVISLALLAGVALFTVDRALAGAVGSELGVVVTAVALLAAAGAIIGASWLVDRRYVRDLGLALTDLWWRDCVAGLVVGVLMGVVAVVTAFAAGVATFTGSSGAAGIAGGAVGATLLALVSFVGIAVLEEVFFRGYLLVNTAEGLAGFLGRRDAVLVSVGVAASLFGFLHAANPGGGVLALFNIVLAGVVLGGTYALTARLGLAIGIHFAWNATLGPVFGLPVSGLASGSALLGVRLDGATIITGGAFGPEGGLVMVPALVVGGLLAVGWIRYTEGELWLQTHVAEPDLRPYTAEDDAEPTGDTA